MNMANKLSYVGNVLIFLLLFIDITVYAYIDPGVGSFIFQMLIAGLVGASFLIKIFWKQIKEFFNKHVMRRQIDEDE